MSVSFRPINFSVRLAPPLRITIVIRRLTECVTVRDVITPQISFHSIKHLPSCIIKVIAYASTFYFLFEVKGASKE